MSEYNVTAERDGDYWELHVDGVGVTQCRTLDEADEMVRDYLTLRLDADVSHAVIRVTPKIEGLTDAVVGLRRLHARIAELSLDAETARLELIKEMRAEGFSLADVAGAVGVSKGRVSQLIGK